MVRNAGELRFAPHGASDAECAVCGWKTMKRVVEADGFVPICSPSCLQAWPRVRALLADRDEAVRRAESAELGCELAYRREPTQAEGDAHEYRHDQSMGASSAAGESFVPMGGHHGWKCKCGTWVWGGPTACQRCVDADAVKIALEWKAEADRLRKLFADAGQGEHNVLALIDYYQSNTLAADASLRAVRLLLEANGCDCDCGHDSESHDTDCDRCLGCRVEMALRPSAAWARERAKALRP